MTTDDGHVKVLIYGLGAIGSFYAFILGRLPNVELTVVARSNYEAVKANGLIIESENHGSHVIKPHQVVKTVHEAHKFFDYIVCAHKAIDQDAVPEQIAAGVNAHNSTIVIIQNGVGNEEPFRKRFPTTTILSCVTWVGARQSSPGHIAHTKSEDMQVGLYPSEGNQERDQGRLDLFAKLLTDGQTVFQVVPNIQVQRWEKVVWNAAWNSLTSLTLLDTHAWLSSSAGATPLTRQLMTEVIDVANKCGVPIEHSLIDTLIDKILAMPPIGSSMQADLKAEKPMEVEVILGTPYRKGKELGVNVPILETLYLVLTAVNTRFLKQ